MMGENEKNSNGICINDILTDDGLRAILAKLENFSEKDNYGLVCKRWLYLQSTERRRLCARAGPVMLQRLANRFSRVVDLDFSQSVSRSFFPGVCDKDLEVIATKFNCLHTINLRHCNGVTDAGLKALGKGLPNLLSLDVSQCKRLTDKGIQALVEGCPTLAILRLGGCRLITDASMEAVSKNCTKLEELELQSCVNITDNGISTLAQGCRLIESLDISKCVKVGDGGVVRVAQFCSLLKILKLSDCSKIGNKAVMSLAEGCKSLEIVMIGGCRLVSDEAIKPLASLCGHSLRTLQLEWCLDISNESVLTILSLCLQLESLDIACCNKITDLAFTPLGEGGCGSALKVLKLSSCPGITVKGISLIAEFCQCLQYLDVRSCPHVTREGIDRAGLHFPDHCKLIYYGTISERAL